MSRSALLDCAHLHVHLLLFCSYSAAAAAALPGQVSAEGVTNSWAGPGPRRPPAANTAGADERGVPAGGAEGLLAGAGDLRTAVCALFVTCNELFLLWQFQGMRCPEGTRAGPTPFSENLLQQMPSFSTPVMTQAAAAPGIS
jgi:hypothetical protein